MSHRVHDDAQRPYTAKMTKEDSDDDWMNYCCDSDHACVEPHFDYDSCSFSNDDADVDGTGDSPPDSN